MEGHLWVISTRLNAQVPAAAFIVKGITGHFRDIDERSRQLVFEPKTVFIILIDKERPAEPKGESQMRGRKIVGFSRVLRRGLISGDITHNFTSHELLGSGSTVFKKFLDFFFIGCFEGESHKVHTILHFGGNAALVLPEERVGIFHLLTLIIFTVVLLLLGSAAGECTCCGNTNSSQCGTG